MLKEFKIYLGHKLQMISYEITYKSSLQNK